MNEKITIQFVKEGIWNAREKYTIEWLQQHPLKPDYLSFTEIPSANTIKIGYGKVSLSVDYQMPQIVSLAELENNLDKLCCNRIRINPKEVVVIDNERKPIDTFLHGNVFSFDIFLSIFFCISRIEEYQNTGFDQFGMMPYHKMLLVKENVVHQPILDQLSVAFFEFFTHSTILQSSKLVLTSDIDVLEKYPSFLKFLKHNTRLILENKWTKVPSVWKEYIQIQRKEISEPYDTFDMLLSLMNSKKTIFLIVGGQHRFDTPLNINSISFQKLLENILKTDYQIGLHPSYEAAHQRELFMEEKYVLERRIGKPIFESRQHFLHFNFKKTPQILQEAAIQIDSSIGFNDRVGFRCGTGFNFRLYDFRLEKPFDWMEQPLIIMDTALWRNAALEKGSLFLKLLTSFLQDNQFNTQLTINFHNSTFSKMMIQESYNLLKRFSS